MLGKMARGTYIFVLAAMIVVWVFSFGKEAPAESQSTQEISYIYC